MSLPGFRVLSSVTQAVVCLWACFVEDPSRKAGRVCSSSCPCARRSPVLAAGPPAERLELGPRGGSLPACSPCRAPLLALQQHLAARLQVTAQKAWNLPGGPKRGSSASFPPCRCSAHRGGGWAGGCPSPAFGVSSSRAGYGDLRGKGSHGGLVLVVSISLRTKGYLACDAGAASARRGIAWGVNQKWKLSRCSRGQAGRRKEEKEWGDVEDVLLRQEMRRTQWHYLCIRSLW